MTPQTVNAYYDPSMNSLNVPAGILQPPYFDVSWPDAVNYGATGATIGHEMTHGFDDEGAKFDGHGNLKDWWAPEDLRKFRNATRCISEQYSRFTVSGGLHVQGRLGDRRGDCRSRRFDVGMACAACAAERATGQRAIRQRAIRRAAIRRPPRIHARSAVLHCLRAFLGGGHTPRASSGNGDDRPAPARAIPHQCDTRQQPRLSVRVWDPRLEPHGQGGALRHLVRFDSSRSFSLSRIRTGESAL